MSDQPPPLKYEPESRAQRPGVPVALQAVIGVVALGATLGLIIAFLFIVSTDHSDVSMYVAIFLPIGLLLASAIYVVIRLRWRGYIPGIIIGFALSCLIGIGLCFAAFNHAKI